VEIKTSILPARRERSGEEDDLEAVAMAAAAGGGVAAGGVDGADGAWAWRPLRATVEQLKIDLEKQ
jgi:hypothetical protein